MIAFLERLLPTFGRGDIEFRISLDHDLGACEQCQREHEDRWGFGLISECPHIGTGYDVCKYLEELTFTLMNVRQLPFMTITVHSDNAGARGKMLQSIANIERFLASS